MLKKSFLLITIIMFICGNAYNAQKMIIPSMSIDAVQAVIRGANEGDTIIVKSGTYIFNDTLKIENKKRISIVGDGKVRFILTEPTMAVIHVENTQGLIIRNIHASHKPVAQGCSGFVLSASYSSGLRIDHCQLNGCGAVGFITWHCQDIIVSHSKIYNNSKNGLSFNQTVKIVIQDSKIFRNKESGIALYQCSHVRVTNCRISKNKYGVSLGETTGLSVDRVKFSSNTENISRF